MDNTSLDSKKLPSTLAAACRLMRQDKIGPNKWVSKLGNWYDIEHTPDAVSSGDYGQVAKYMKRRKP